MRTGILYSGAHFLAALLNSVSAFVVRLWVPAAAFGGVAVAAATMEYYRAGDALLRNAIDREVPVHLARGDEEGARQLLRGAYAMTVGVLLLESAVMVGLGVWAREPLLRLAWWVYAIVNLCDGLAQTDRMALKATQRFGAHNRALVLAGLVGGAALLAASWRWGAPGWFAGLAANAALGLALYRREMRGADFRPAVRGVPRAVFRRILAVGGLLAALKLSQTLLLTADRWVVVGHLGLRELGYYSLGAAVAARLYLLPQTLVGSFSPRLNGMLGNGRMDEARAAVAKLQRTTALVSACTCGAVALAIGPLVHRFLPDYAPAVPAFLVMVAGAYFLAMNATSMQVHVGLGAAGRGIPAAVAALAVTVGLAIPGVARYGLVGAAVARTAGMAVYAVALDASTRRLLGIAGLARAALGGAAALGVLLVLLALVGEWAALAWLAAYGAYAVRTLSWMHDLGWRDVPRLLRRRGSA